MSRLTQSLRPIASSSRAGLRSFHSSRIAREHFINVDDQAFKSRALDAQSSKPILVDFFATWCQPCKVLSPVLERLTPADSGYDLMTIDVDQYPEVAGEYNIAALPTILAFKDGKPVNKFVGVLKEQQIKDFLAKL